MGIHRTLVDPVHAKCSRCESGNRHGWRDQQICPPEQFDESIPQLRAAMHRVDVFSATIVAAARDDCVVVEIRTAEQSFLPPHDCSRLLGISNRFDGALQRFWIDTGGVGHHLGTEFGQCLHCGGKRGPHVRRDRCESKIRRESDAQALKRSRGHVQAARRDRQAGGIADVITGDDFEQQRHVAYGPPDGTGVS